MVTVPQGEECIDVSLLKVNDILLTGLSESVSKYDELN